MKPLRECELPEPTDLLQQLWAVMSDPDTAAYQEKRQLILLETFFSVVGESLKLGDIQLVSKIMDVISTKAEIESKYQQNYQKFLDLLKAPIRMEKCSDQLEYQPSLVELFTNLGYTLLRTSNKEVKSQVLDIVLRILLTKRVGDTNMIPRKQCIRALEVSNFAECLADFIPVSTDDIYSLTILTALEICAMSKLCCWTLLMKEVVESVLVRLTLFNNEEVADIIYNLLWTLFNCTNLREDWERVPKPSLLALRSLRYVLREQALINGHPGRENSVIHNLAALVLKIIHLFPEADYVNSGLIEDITVSATLSETVLEIHIIPFFKSKQDHLHFKKLMLACLAVSPINTRSVDIFERNKLAECLVAILQLDSTRMASWLTKTSILSLRSAQSTSTTDSELSWLTFDQEQSIDLFKTAIHVVCALFDCLWMRFIKAGLMKTLTSFLIIYYLQEELPPDDLFNLVIKTILLVCYNKRDPEKVKTDARESATVPVLLEFCDVFLTPNFALTTGLQSALCHILHVLATLMEDEQDFQIHYADDSFRIVKALYHRIITPLPIDSMIDNRLVVAVCNFAWVVLVSNEQNLLRYIDSGEIYSHLDILTQGSPSIQSVCLSMLVDVSENQKSVPYLVSWRGPKGVKLISVLCNIWRNEESRLNVPRSEFGCITDIERPLMGDYQYRLSKEEKKKCISFCDVFGSCRPPIYSLIQLLHRHEEVTKLCEEHYKIGHDILPWEDQVTLRLIEAYLPLKLGEVWWEIMNKQDAGVLPLDRYLTQTLADRYLNWSLNVQRAQHSVLKQRDAALRSEEQQYYSQVKSVRLTAALEALREVTMIARTADRQMLLEAQQRLREGIEASRPAAAVVADLHITFPRDFRILLSNPAAEVVLQEKPA